MVPESLLTLYAAGLVTGLPVVSGDEMTYAVPIFESNIIYQGFRSIHIGGRHVTEYLIKLLGKRGMNFGTNSDFKYISNMKEQYCFVSQNLQSNRGLLAKKPEEFTVPFYYNSTKPIILKSERFEAPEVIFEPQYLDLPSPTLSETVFDAIMQTDINYRRDYFRNIVLSGGNTLFRNFAIRLNNDLKPLVLNKIMGGDTSKLTNQYIAIESHSYNRFMSYIGGVSFANLSRGKSLSWSQKNEWDSDPNSVIKRWTFPYPLD